MKDRASLIKVYVDNGIFDLNEIREDYNSFDSGGPLKSKSNSEYRVEYAALENNLPYNDVKPGQEGLQTYNNQMYNHREEEAMYEYLRTKGVPHTQASAIMGNISVESFLDPRIKQIGGSGEGLIQATDPDRKERFKNFKGDVYMFGSGLDPETQRQLDFIVNEGLNKFTSGEWRHNHKISRARDARKKFINTEDLIEASDIFTENYLRPGKPHLERRREMTEYFNSKYNTYKNRENKLFLFK